MYDFKTFHDDPIEKSERSALGNAKYRGAMPNFPKNGNDRQVAKYFDEVREAGFHQRLVPIFESGLEAYLTNRKIVATVTITKEEAIFYLARTHGTSKCSVNSIEHRKFLQLMLYHIFKCNAYYDEYSNHVYDLTNLTIEQKTMLMFYKMCLYHLELSTEQLEKEFFYCPKIPILEERNPEFYRYLKNLPDGVCEFTPSHENIKELLGYWHLFSDWLNPYNHNANPRKQSSYGVRNLEQLGLYCSNLMAELPDHPLPMKYFVQDLVRGAEVRSTTFKSSIYYSAVFIPMSEEEFRNMYHTTSKCIEKRVKMVLNPNAQLGVKYIPENYKNLKNTPFQRGEVSNVLFAIKKYLNSTNGSSSIIVIKNEVTGRYKVLYVLYWEKDYGYARVFDTNEDNLLLWDEPYVISNKAMKDSKLRKEIEEYGTGFKMHSHYYIETERRRLRRLFKDVRISEYYVVMNCFEHFDQFLQNHSKYKIVEDILYNFDKLDLSKDDVVLDAFYAKGSTEEDEACMFIFSWMFKILGGFFGL